MNIYVGNLDFKVKENELEKIFADFGNVESVNIITDKFSGKSKGFGFVTMVNKQEAELAIKELNGIILKNRNIVVNEARPKKESYS
jgi:RNA recognition motif-containing protein